MSESQPASSDLQQTLAHLHEQLQALPTVDAGTRQQLTASLAEIQAFLNRPAGAAPDQAAQEHLTERLRQIATEFEVSHPTLTGVVGRLADALSQMGI